MACLDCDDSITSIPSGPPGPTGPTGPTGATGPAPVISGTSTTSLLIATGTKNFTTQSGIAWVQGQRLRAVDSTGNNLMEGEVITYVGTALSLDVDHIEGSGTIASWTISIAGSVGSTGSTGTAGSAGENAFGTTTAVATANGGGSYTIPLTDNTWCVVGETVYVETSGYYKITGITPGADITVYDDTLIYTAPVANIPNNMTGSSGLQVTPGGVRGAGGGAGSTGATGATGPTGPQGPIYSFIQGDLFPASVAASTDFSAIVSATSTANLFYTGYVVVKASIESTINLIFKVGGVPVGINVFHTMAPVIGGAPKTYATIHFSGIVPIVIGNPFDVTVESDDYATTLELDSGFIYYSYQ